MPVWTVQVAGGRDERIEAGMLATEAGVLVALSEEGLMVRAWAPGEWRTVQQLVGARVSGPTPRSSVLVGLPHD